MPAHKRLDQITESGFCLQACRSVGEDCGFFMCHCRCADHRTARTGYSIQFQLFLPSGDGPGGDAVPEFQPRDQLSLPAWHAGSAYEEEFAE